jgi:hypothetical protein
LPPTLDFISKVCYKKQLAAIVAADERFNRGTYNRTSKRRMVMMGLSQSFGQVVRQEQAIRQELRLTIEQRQQLAARLLQIRFELLQALRGDKYEPRGVCPKCGRKHTAQEIIGGFNQDPLDYTTACTACVTRFEPKIISQRDNSIIELPFYCDVQTLDQLHGHESLKPKRLKKKFPAIYHSAIVHFGSIGRAMEKIGLVYPFEEKLDWRHKIVPFLGRMPDTLIAKFANVNVWSVRSLRRKNGIEKFSAREALDL